MNTTYTLTTITIEDDSLSHCNTEVFKVEGENHSLVTILSIIMSEWGGEIIVYNSDDESLTISDDKIIQNLDEIQHVLQRIR